MLLMIDPVEREPQAPRSTRVAPGMAGSIEVLQGQLLRITCLQAGATAALFGFAQDDPQTYLSVHHTRVFSNSYVLGLGMRLVSNRRRPLMVLGKDTVGTHDLLMPASTCADLARLGCADGMGCADAVQAELDRLAIQPQRFPDPVNLFMNVRLHTDGRLEPLACTSRAGDHVVFRVLRDMVFIVAACDTAIDGHRTAGALEMRVAEDLAAL